MGSACCIAARDRTLQNGTSNEAFHRAIRYSPSWSYRWDNRGRVSSDVDYPMDEYSHGISRSAGFNTKGGRDVEFSEISDGGSPVENFQTPTPQMIPSDLSKGNSFHTEVKDFVESPAVVDSSVTSPILMSTVNPLFSQNLPLPADSMSSRHDYNSPTHQHLRQISDGRVPELRPLNTSICEGRRSYAPSTFSNELVLCSHGGSSDVWSMLTFSELVASSRRDRWSFDSKALDFAHGNVIGSNSRLLASPSIDTRTCGVCSKLLTERSLWSGQKIMVSNELSVAAILVCGHVYHAECLEHMTPETDRYDPPCPVCTTGDKQPFKVYRKALTMEADSRARNRMSRSQVMDSYLKSNDAGPGCGRSTGREEKRPKIGPSSSMKSSFTRPFLRRHFSLRSKSAKSILENDSIARAAPGRKGFWARYLRE